MAEIPEHLLKRAQAAREKAAAEAGAATPEPAAETPAAAAGAGDAASEPAGDPRIPAHLLERSRAAKQKSDGGEAPASGGGVAVADKVASVVQAGPSPAAGVPVGAGPGGHTQRLLTVVKSGSIQDVKAQPVDKVHTWPHLLAAEFVASLACLLFTFLFSVWVNAPLLQHSNPNQTPNPSKAPWYFLGLQELLTMFHPMIAGVTIPGVGLIVLIFAPYIDKNPSNKPEDRKFATSLMTIHIMFWSVLVMIGSFFRGPGFNFTLPWRDGLFFEL
jgi:menaquinol-cytochrome c reductase cytochrome b/c subunit